MKRAYANSFDFDPAKPLVIPFGRYPHKQKGVVQVIDRRSADGFQESLRVALANGAPGLPVYVGHPDVPDLAARFPDKGAKGWVESIDVQEGECRLAVAWCDEPKPGAFIYFSPYLAGEDAAGGEVIIDELRSIGLTNRPNCTRFRLPNEAGDDATTTNTEGNTQMQKLLTLLGLAPEATEEDAIAKVQGLLEEITALKRKGEEDAATVATANQAADEARAAFANEREARIGLLLDDALRDGKVTPATRPVWAGRLRTDFANETEALAKECAGIKTRSALANDRADTTPAGILAKYEAMPTGPEKEAFLRSHAQVINDARCARG